MSTGTKGQDTAENDQGPEFLTVEAAAKSAGITTKTIRRWLDAGRLKATMARRGGARLLQIDPADLTAAIAAKPRKQQTRPLPAVLEETKAALIESTQRHEIELERARQDLEAALARQVEAEAREAERQKQTAELLAALGRSIQAVENLTAETHELKAQVSMLQDQVLRALPAPAQIEQPPSIWQKISRALGIGRKV